MSCSGSRGEPSALDGRSSFVAELLLELFQTVGGADLPEALARAEGAQAVLARKAGQEHRERPRFGFAHRLDHAAPERDRAVVDVIELGVALAGYVAHDAVAVGLDVALVPAILVEEDAHR